MREAGRRSVVGGSAAAARGTVKKAATANAARISIGDGRFTGVKEEVTDRLKTATLSIDVLNSSFDR